MRRLSLAAAALLCCGGPLAAQDAGAWWLGVAAGSGFQSVSCGICRTGLESGVTVRAAGGRLLSDRMLGGMQVQVWTDAADDVRTTFLTVGPTAHWYPGTLARPQFLIGALSYARYGATATDEEPVTASSLGLTFGAGWDVPLSRRFTMTPIVTMTVTMLGELERDGTDIASAGFSLIQLGVGLGWR